jgi:MFS family permease
LSFSLPSAILLYINADIGPSAQITWGATAWSLATAVLQTIAGRCSDIFGRRNFILAGNVFGLVGMYRVSEPSSLYATADMI